MLIADADTVHEHLPYPQLVAALRDAHLATSPDFAAVVAADPTGRPNSFLALTAWAPGDMIAAKLVSVFPGNAGTTSGQPSVQGLVVLFDGADGSVRLVADGAAMTFRKTAADSALGAQLLAREDAETLLVVGAGGLAPHVIAAHRSVRPSLRRVLLWNRSPGRAAELAAELPGVDAVTDLDAAIGRADIISCVTMATEPLVRGALLRPGTHVDLVGSFTPAMREADDATLTRAAVFVDTRNGLERSGEIQHALASGALTSADIRGDLFELCSGAVAGRTDGEQITVFKNVGGAHLDLFTARHLLAQLAP